MIEGVRGNLSYKECLNILRNWEQGWRELSWLEDRRIDLPNSEQVDRTYPVFQFSEGSLYTFGCFMNKETVSVASVPVLCRDDFEAHSVSGLTFEEHSLEIEFQVENISVPRCFSRSYRTFGTD